MSRKTKLHIRSEHYLFQPTESEKYVNNIKKLIALMYYEEYKKNK